MINRQQIQEIIDWYKSENAFLMQTDDLQMNQVNHTLYIAHETFIAKLQEVLNKEKKPKSEVNYDTQKTD